VRPNERKALENRMCTVAYRIVARRQARHVSERPVEADCPICGIVVTGLKMHRDHDHANGQFRAYLCRDCNLGLGRFKDSPSLLRKAALYLEAMKDTDTYSADGLIKYVEEP